MHRHPNGDIYFYNRELRLITPDDITDSEKLALVMESWDEHMRNMEYDPIGRTLGDDWELMLSDVTESSVVIEVISRNAGRAYKWSDDRGSFIHILTIAGTNHSRVTGYRPTTTGRQGTLLVPSRRISLAPFGTSSRC